MLVHSSKHVYAHYWILFRVLGDPHRNVVREKE